MRVHCLFEQSGVFRDAFIKLGYEAYDYDEANEFGNTDFIVDLFQQIELAYDGKESIFDHIERDDLIVTFFPCIRFSAQALPLFSENNYNFHELTDVEIMQRCRIYNQEQSYLYQLVCKLFIICYRKEFRMIMENPYTQPHYLTMYFPVRPKVIDKDRTKLGDYFKKPTQYWFVNCEPYDNPIYQEFVFGQKKKYNNIATRYYESEDLLDETLSKAIKRSMVSPKYAENFIKKYVIKGEKENED